MIEKPFLPDLPAQTGFALQCLGRPFFPFSDKLRQRYALLAIGAEKVNVIRHDDIRANGPAVPFHGGFPFPA